MKKVELLAPAGNFDALKAAIAAGADAVYLGGSGFGARAYAKNFNNEELVEAIKLAHLYNVKVYVTINTLVYDYEFSDVVNYINFLYLNDADAIIVQDLGLMRVISRLFPDIEIHASTQMTINNAEGAKLLKENRVKRIVLARENTLDEISQINKQVDIETEVFVHGALCVCYSGQCLMSSLIGGRSGNRGRCAQPCRKLYDLVLNQDVIEKSKYFLSPKDLNIIENIDQVIESGVNSLKIEGRMKSPLYVAIVVSIYRSVINNYYKKQKVEVTKSNLDDLKQIFNRQFTKGFMFGEKGNDFINLDKNNNSGLLCGKVVSSNNNKITIKCSKPINLKDGIYFHNTNFGLTISKMWINNKEIAHADVSDIITVVFKERVKVGSDVYKTADIVLEQKAKEISQNLNQKVPIYGEVELFINCKPKIKIWDGLGNKVEREVDFIIEKSNGIPLTKSRIEDQLNKLGNTPFYFNNLTIKQDESIFIVISLLNQLRREGIEQLIYLRENRYHRRNTNTYKYEYQVSEKSNKPIVLAVFCQDLEQVEAAVECNIKKIYVNEELYKHLDDDTIICVKNRINTKPKISETNEILVSDLGSLYLAKNNKNIITTNFNLNVTNSETINFLLDNNVSTITLSYELNEFGYKKLMYSDKAILEIVVYGYQEAMVTKHCIFSQNCRKQCLQKNYYLVDGKNEKFLVQMDYNCHMNIYNSKKLIFKDELLKLKNYGYKQFRLQFINEDKSETINIIKAYQSILFENDDSFLKNILESEKENYTKGYFNKEIL